uniref:Uncharacterized protein n=1 Tax=Rhizophora mucronata TaxID=61149 RepID=A0A2P2PHL7_RHIMU
MLVDKMVECLLYYSLPSQKHSCCRLFSVAVDLLGGTWQICSDCFCLCRSKGYQL